MKPKINLNGPWELLVYSDVDCVGDNNTGKSATGCIVLISGVFLA